MVFPTIQIVTYYFLVIRINNMTKFIYYICFINSSFHNAAKWQQSISLTVIYCKL